MGDSNAIIYSSTATGERRARALLPNDDERGGALYNTMFIKQKRKGTGMKVDSAKRVTYSTQKERD